jgi:hypothetical protein
MSKEFEIIAKLRDQYPDEDSLKAIKEEEARLKALLELKQYTLLPETQNLLGILRAGIVARRVKLATDRRLSEEDRSQAFAEIDARTDLMRILARDLDSELAAIRQDLTAQLAA